jgi:hypothetical protein
MLRQRLASFPTNIETCAGITHAHQPGDGFVTEGNGKHSHRLGHSINKKYVTTHLALFDKEIRDFNGLLLKQRKDGTLNTNEVEVNRLLATREQVDELCSRFFEKFPEAKGVSFALQNFIDVVSRRTGKIEEYNDKLATLYRVSAEMNRTNEQLKTAQTHSPVLRRPGFR